MMQIAVCLSCDLASVAAFADGIGSQNQFPASLQALRHLGEALAALRHLDVLDLGRLHYFRIS
jgi:hypothetical protein